MQILTEIAEIEMFLPNYHGLFLLIKVMTAMPCRIRSLRSLRPTQDAPAEPTGEHPRVGHFRLPLTLGPLRPRPRVRLDPNTSYSMTLTCKPSKRLKS